MSRIGRMPITVPEKVEVKFGDDRVLTVKGPKGMLSERIHPDMILNIEPNVITVERPSEMKQHKALHGLTRALVANMVTGVTDMFKKELDINGVGYRAQKQGKQLLLNLGYSHNIVIEEEDGITFETPAPNKIIVTGLSKQRVGQIASEIRGKRPPEPYLGKGVKYSNETIRRKTGKAGK